MLHQFDFLEASPRIKSALQVSHLQYDVDLTQLALEDRATQPILDGIILGHLLVHIEPANLCLLEDLNHRLFLLFLDCNFARSLKYSKHVRDLVLKFLFHAYFVSLFDRI